MQRMDTWTKRPARLHAVAMIVAELIVILCLTSCTQRLNREAAAPGSTRAAPFLVALNQEVSVDLAILGDEQPLTNALITIRALPHPTDPKFKRSTVLFQGMTQTDGHVRGKFVRHVDQDNLDVLIHVPGHSGPYDDETLRRQLGRYAPSAWLRMPPARLASATIQLHPLRTKSL